LLLTFKFRLYPNCAEEQRLLWTLEQCRLVYNRLLEEFNKGELGFFDLKRQIPLFRLEIPSLATIYSRPLYDQAWRLRYNIHTLARFRSEGRNVGNLRFKAKGSFKSFTYDRGFKFEEMEGRFSLLRLSMIGSIPIRLHRPIRGHPKTVTVKRHSSGKWFAYVVADEGSQATPVTGRHAVGIDVGLQALAVDSDGGVIENPKTMKRILKRLRREKRRLSRKEFRSKNWEKQRVIVARSYERATNQRNDFLHKIARYYAENYDIIVTENLQIRSMLRHRSLGEAIADASWGTLNRMIAYKAENAGKVFVQCDPRGTSVNCSMCGAPVPKDLQERSHICDHCGFATTRDHNAALNILAKGLVELGSGRPELTLVDIRPLHKLKPMQAGWMKQEWNDASRRTTS